MRYRPWLALAGSLAVLGGIAALWWQPRHDDPLPDAPGERSPVVVYCAAALRPALEKAAPGFERETGIKVELRFGASEWLLQNLKLTKQSDLFLPADDWYVAQAREAGLVEQDYALATLTAVAVLRADFPKDANDVTWDDLLRPSF